MVLQSNGIASLQARILLHFVAVPVFCFILSQAKNYELNHRLQRRQFDAKYPPSESRLPEINSWLDFENRRRNQ